MQRYEYLLIHRSADVEVGRSRDLLEDPSICRSMDIQILKSVDPWMYRFYILESQDLRICACRHLKIRGFMDVEILTSEDLQILWPVNAWIERYVQWCRDIKIHGSRYPKIQDLWTHGCRDTGLWRSTDIRDPWIHECRSMNIWWYIDVQILESKDLSQPILLINMS